MYQSSIHPTSPVDLIVERLVSAGHSAAAVNAAVALIRAGAAELVQQVLLDVEQAWRIARGQR